MAFATAGIEKVLGRVFELGKGKEYSEFLPERYQMLWSTMPPVRRADHDQTLNYSQVDEKGWKGDIEFKPAELICKADQRVYGLGLCPDCREQMEVCHEAGDARIRCSSGRHEDKPFRGRCGCGHALEFYLIGNERTTIREYMVRMILGGTHSIRRPHKNRDSRQRSKEEGMAATSNFVQAIGNFSADVSDVLWRLEALGEVRTVDAPMRSDARYAFSLTVKGRERLKQFYDTKLDQFCLREPVAEFMEWVFADLTDMHVIEDCDRKISEITYKGTETPVSEKVDEYHLYDVRRPEMGHAEKYYKELCEWE
ncbi:MAG: hypothetical protein QXU82_02015 [Candidatus Aenigmatarchaeota archaeon]